jgi:hypothetical protein
MLCKKNQKNEYTPEHCYDPTSSLQQGALIKYIVKIKQFAFCVERYIRRQERERERWVCRNKECGARKTKRMNTDRHI